MTRTISQYNLEAMETPNGQRYLSVIIETVTQRADGVWGLATKVADVASFPAKSANVWGDRTRRPAEHFMWRLQGMIGHDRYWPEGIAHN